MKILNWLRPGIGRLRIYAPRPVAYDDLLPRGKSDTSSLPRITIVVPSYNQGRFIGATLESIVSQKYPNLELIVVDGGSTDDTISVIKRFEPHLSWWVSERDSGQAAAINKGFQRSSGDIMAWINSDDLIAPGALAQVVTHLKDWSAPQVVYGNRIVIDEEGLEVGRWVLPYHSSQILRWVDFVPQETMYWTRSAWELAGSEIDESLGFAIDWEFLLRLSHRGTRFVHLPYFTGLFRVHGDQKTSSQISSKGWEEMGRLRLQELGRVPHQWEILGRISPFLLAARCLEIKLALIGIAAGKGRLRIS